MSIFREIRDLFRFFFKTPVQDKDIVFYAENENYYPYFEGIVKELTEKNNKKICYISSQHQDPILISNNKHILTFYSKHLLSFFFLFIKCKVLIMTLFEFDKYHLKKSIYPVHYIFVFHGACSTHMTPPAQGIDAYDTIFCVGDHHVKEIRKNEKINHLPAKTLVKCGFYRIERIYDAYKTLPAGAKTSDQIKVLIAPTWGKISLVKTGGIQMIGHLLDHNCRVTLRLHPESYKRDVKEIAVIQQKFGENPLFFLETSVISDQSLIESTHLITDWSAVMFDFAFATERPVLLIDLPPKIHNKDFEQLGIEPIEIQLRNKIGVSLKPHELDKTFDTLQWLRDHQEDFRENIITARNNTLYSFGHSSEKGVEYILNFLKSP